MSDTGSKTDEFYKRVIDASSTIGHEWMNNNPTLTRNVDYLLTHSPKTLDAVVASCKENRDNKNLWRTFLIKEDWYNGAQSKIKYGPEDCTPDEQSGGDAVPLVNDYLALLPITRRVIEKRVGNTAGTNPYIMLNMDVASTMVLNEGMQRTPTNLQAALLQKFINRAYSADREMIECVAARLDEVEAHIPQLQEIEDITPAKVEAVLDGIVPAALFDGVI